MSLTMVDDALGWRERRVVVMVLERGQFRERESVREIGRQERMGFVICEFRGFVGAVFI